MKKIILGSASEGRRSVLKGMGYEFDVVPADIDEKAIRFDDPNELTLALAHAKADAILEKIDRGATDTLLITSDQVVLFESVIREKPEDEVEARAFLKSYSDREAKTVTSVVVTDIANGNRNEGTDIVTITFDSIPESVIQKIIAEDRIFSCAGGLLIEGTIEPHIENIDGERESVYGLPAKLTRQLLMPFFENEQKSII